MFHVAGTPGETAVVPPTSLRLHTLLNTLGVTNSSDHRCIRPACGVARAVPATTSTRPPSIPMCYAMAGLADRARCASLKINLCSARFMKSMMQFLVTLLACGSGSHAAFAQPGNVDKAQSEMWRRFVDEHGVVLDAVDVNGHYERPTAEECRGREAQCAGVACSNGERCRCSPGSTSMRPFSAGGRVTPKTVRKKSGGSPHGLMFLAQRSAAARLYREKFGDRWHHTLSDGLQ